MKTTIIRITGSSLAISGCLLLGGGVASAQSISTTGPGSTNIISTDTTCRSSVENNNIIDIISNNPQSADSGSVSTDQNTTVGSVTSGNANNSSNTVVDVNVSNDSGNGCQPALEQTTPSSPETPDMPSATPAVSGGRGSGENVAVQQVAMPVGAVGAGQGGSAYLQTLIAVTLASTVWAIARVRKLYHA